MSSQAAIGPPSARDRAPLRRRPDDGMLGGVCAGLAHRLEVNVKVVRVLTAMIAGVGGAGLAAYALAWAVVPVDPESRGSAATARRMARGGPDARRGGGVRVGAAPLGLGLEQSILWPAVIGICGLALVWRQPAGEAGPAGDAAGAVRTPGRAASRRAPLGASATARASCSAC